MKHDVFISYSSQNKEAAQAVCHILEQNSIRCWIAPRDIPGGAKYGDCIDEAIKSTKVVVMLFSKTAAVSHFVMSEINIAISEQKKVIPFRLDETPLKGENRVMLNTIHWIDAYPDYKTKFGELVSDVRQSLGQNADLEPKVETERQKTSWYSHIFDEDFHPLMRFLIALQIIIYGITFINFVWTSLWGCLAFYHDFQISLCLLCCCLFLSLFSTLRLWTRKVLWWSLIILLDYISAFYLCVISKYLYTNWPSFSTLQIPSSMRYRLLYIIGESMGDSYFIHPYLLLFAVTHTILICAVLCLRYKGITGWQIFK